MNIESVFGTDFTHPCWRCGELPREADLWRIENIGGAIREGHSKCFTEKITDTRIGGKEKPPLTGDKD